MPAPTFLELCTTPINSIPQFVQDFLHKYMKQNFKVPPQVLEIQSLDGQKPGDKLKCFNAIVNRIADNVKNGDELESQLSPLSPLLLNLVKTNVGVKLQLDNIIVESLKSEDAIIARTALKARWFFDGGNPRVVADYFVKDILPFVSVRTRLDIIKRLARGLRGHEDKAQQFFVAFVDLYGIQPNLPILIVCSEMFIFDSILRYKIVLPTRILNILYSRGSRDIVIRYLKLSNAENIDDDKGHKINIHDYDVFLPKLIRHYPQDFVVFYELTPEKVLPTLSSRRTAWLLKNAKDAIVNKSDIYLKLLQSKVVKSKLSRDDIGTMLEHYLPKRIADFRLDAALDFVNNYLGNDDINVLMSKFEKLYHRSLLDYALKVIDADTNCPSFKLLRKLSASERESEIKFLLANVGRNAEMKHVIMSHSNTSESLRYFKAQMCKSSNADERMQCIGWMIVSCGLQNNKNDLLEVLKYFREWHGHEHKVVLYHFLSNLSNEFDLSSLDDTHWSVVRDIMNNACIRKELYKSDVTLTETVLEAMLRHAMTRKRRDDRYVDEAIELILEGKVVNFSPTWNVCKDNLALEKECLEKFFLLAPVKFPENHSIWNDQNARIALTLYLLKTIDSYNGRCAKKKNKTTKINLTDYPWILKLSEEFMCPLITGFRKEMIVKLIKQQAPDFYVAQMSEKSPIHDIANGDAYQLLKRQPERILEHWLEYLNEARDKLQSSDRASFDKARVRLRARRFIAATKWHHQLPVKFIEACLSDMKTAGSLIVLGILLPGETYKEIAAAYPPKQAQKNTKESYETTCALLEGMKMTNPPVSLDSLQPFCRDGVFRPIAYGTMTSIASRVNVASAVEFAKKLASQPQGPWMKCGINLAKIVTTRQQFRDLLSETWKKSNADAPANASIRRSISKMIFENFVKSPPHKDTWQLMLSCLRGLTADDKEAFQDLNEIEKIANEFLSDYVDEYLGKIEQFFAASMDVEWKSHCICLLVESFDDKSTRQLSEEVVSKILKKYFFDADCIDISRAVRTFAVRYCLLACDDSDKFESRLNVLLDIMKKITENFDVSHPKKRRYCPANYTLQEFFGGLLNELCATDSDKKLCIVEAVLKEFKMSLSPWQEPKSFVALSLYKEYLLSKSPEDFGLRVAKQIASILEDFLSNEPIGDVAECLNDFVFGKVFRNHKSPYYLKMSLIEGLLQGDEYYGALVSTKLLDRKEVRHYDERYDRLISNLRQMKNSAIQYHLYQHLNNLTE